MTLKKAFFLSIPLLLFGLTTRAQDMGAFVTIPAGTFNMGSPDDERGRQPDETLHKVTLTKSFRMQTLEVTQQQYFQIMGNNPSYNNRQEDCPEEHKVVNGVELCPNYPVNVTWMEAQEFISDLNLQQGIDCGSVMTKKGFEKSRNTTGCYRLPTAAEWEYAARAGTQTPWFFGTDPKLISKYAWVDENSGGKFHPVGRLQANPFGLFDIYGNASESVQDYFQKESSSQSQVDPVCTYSKTGHIETRGSGGLFEGSIWHRSANRGWNWPSVNPSGFRLVRTL